MGCTSEELGTVEVGAFGRDGVPADEVRYGQEVAAFIDVACGCQSVEAVELVEEECGEWQPKGKFPWGRGEACVEGFCAERSPAVDGLHHFGWCGLTLVATFACCHKQLARAVALYIIIYAVVGWHAEELGTGVFPDVFVVVTCYGSDALFFYAIV